MTAIRGKARKLDRWFGRCPEKGCKLHRVTDSPYVGATPSTSVPIFYGGYNGEALIAAGLYCSEHGKHLKWGQLAGRVNPEKECNGVCMAAVGPSCDCNCGGENHGRNHV
ncbi:hypothetical protein SEA_HURRICANE_94 [Mycobacterium phage Hurricane]|uniref:Uncharacterized protein n=1 Tax=Mycobacterium phage Hurricane TaxID=2015810 RepID=A0A222ZK56_9CAUD|nr:hypothetical protein I5G83_gp94 [Mycobacterium phage Hurricane]ASR84838.1 hypothetical protein SEA_HURRICANE_94 [Mycobacterium phage Hurricane]